MRIDGEPVSGSLFDAGLHLFHNAQASLERGSGPYVYLPKLESREEARLWNDVFVHAQEALGIARGSVRATVLIETILAAFEMEEILFEPREHASGLDAGRWDYIFSVIKKFSSRHDMVLPDRADVTMKVPFMAAYADLYRRVRSEVVASLDGVLDARRLAQAAALLDGLVLQERFESFLTLPPYEVLRAGG